MLFNKAKTFWLCTQNKKHRAHPKIWLIMSILELKLSRLFFVSKSRSRTDRISDVEQPEEESLIKNELREKHDAWNYQAIIYKKSPMQGRRQGEKVTFGIRGNFAQLVLKLLQTIPASLEEDYILYIINHTYIIYYILHIICYILYSSFWRPSQPGWRRINAISHWN